MSVSYKLCLMDFNRSKEVSSKPKEKSVFHSYLNIMRLIFLLIGHWPYQSRLAKLIIYVIQLTVFSVAAKGQVIQLFFNLF